MGKKCGQLTENHDRMGEKIARSQAKIWKK